MSYKKEQKKDNEPLTCVIVADSYDARFAPLLTTVGLWCLQTICNVPLIYYTLSWIMRTEIRKVLLVVSEKNSDLLKKVESEWSHCFESFSVISCKDANSVGDALRELDSRGLLTGDFLLLSNPATFTSATLQAQIAAFRERRIENKNNVMTLIYSDLKTAKNAVIGIEASSKKLRIYHRKEDPAQLDIDKPDFVSNTVIRRDILDSGVALCSLNIAAQFSDNFDFQHRDDVIRDILVNEEILLQNIHVEILDPFEAAFCVTDYDSLLFLTKLLMERWFFPLVPDRMFSSHCLGFSALSGNVYMAVSEQDFGRLLPAGSVPKRSLNTTFGLRCKVDDTVTTNCATIGNDTHIGPNSLLVNCIIGEKCVIGADCRIVDAVLGNGIRIPDGTNLQKQSIISSEVFYPQDFDIPPNSVVCAEPPNEDFEEMIKYKLVEGVHIWSFANGRSFWSSNEKCDSGNGSMGEENDMENGTESEGGDPVELDATAQFYEEVTESMERIQGFTFNNQQMHNLILEINSSKLAYNISMEDVAKYVFFAFLCLPGNDSWIKLKELCQKWILLLQNYYKPKKSQIQLLLAIEDRFKGNSVAFRPIVPRLVHFLFNDLDILEEESILEWVDSLDEASEVRLLMKPIVDWLQQDSDEKSEDE